MKSIDFYFDVISPYAWLAFQAMPQALQGLSHRVVNRPVLFAAMLKHHGQLGPAEIPAKRAWTYRQVLWLARQQGCDLQLPAAHPFNPLALLRLAAACDAQGLPSRWVCEQVLAHVWCSGQDAADADRLQALTERLRPLRSPQSPEVKADVQAHTQAAIDAGAFGVPTWVVDGHVFWGQDALPMLRAYLEGDAWFDSAQAQQAGQWPVGVSRR